MNQMLGGNPLSGPSPAPKGKHFAEAIIDLIVVPIILGLILGVLTAVLRILDPGRTVILVLANILWLLFRDLVYSPGRALVGVKLISLTGSEKPTILQAILRNLLLLLPFILIVGYIVELVAVIARGSRVGDLWAKTRVVEA